MEKFGECAVVKKTLTDLGETLQKNRWAEQSVCEP